MFSISPGTLCCLPSRHQLRRASAARINSHFYSTVFCGSVCWVSFCFSFGVLCSSWRLCCRAQWGFLEVCHWRLKWSAFDNKVLPYPMFTFDDLGHILCFYSQWKTFPTHPIFATCFFLVQIPRRSQMLLISEHERVSRVTVSQGVSVNGTSWSGRVPRLAPVKTGSAQLHWFFPINQRMPNKTPTTGIRYFIASDGVGVSNHFIASRLTKRFSQVLFALTQSDVPFSFSPNCICSYSIP